MEANIDMNNNTIFNVKDPTQVACSRLSVCGERAKKRASAEKTSGDEGERRKESL